MYVFEEFLINNLHYREFKQCTYEIINGLIQLEENLNSKNGATIV